MLQMLFIDRTTLTKAVNDHVKSLNWGPQSAAEREVNYYKLYDSLKMKVLKVAEAEQRTH